MSNAVVPVLQCANGDVYNVVYRRGGRLEASLEEQESGVTQVDAKTVSLSHRIVRCDTSTERDAQATRGTATPDRGTHWRRPDRCRLL